MSASETAVMLLEWDLHYARWLIGDGEPELLISQDFDWPTLEVWSRDGLEKATELTKSAITASDYHYRVIAEIARVSG